MDWKIRIKGARRKELKKGLTANEEGTAETEELKQLEYHPKQSTRELLRKSQQEIDDQIKELRDQLKHKRKVNRAIKLALQSTD